MVLYGRGGRVEHLAVVVSLYSDLDDTETMVTSKFGEHGEYLHPLDDVPEIYGDRLSFWRGTP